MLSRCRRGLLAPGALFLGGWLAVALFQATHYHVGDKLLFPVIVKFNNDTFFTAGHDGSQAELQVLDLGALRIGVGHIFSVSLSGFVEQQILIRWVGNRAEVPQNLRIMIAD